jgi:hypothetical protein
MAPGCQDRYMYCARAGTSARQARRGARPPGGGAGAGGAELLMTTDD